jgi:hypothetical protein
MARNRNCIETCILCQKTVFRAKKYSVALRPCGKFNFEISIQFFLNTHSCFQLEKKLLDPLYDF